MPTNKTIAISEEIKTQLNEMKIHERETYNDLLIRLITAFNKKKSKKS